MTRAKALAMTPEQYAALRRYAEKHGRRWKSRLSSDWASGRDAEQPDGAYLRQIRNTLGPDWLTGFRMTN